ncbi:hypothetical protein BN136_3844 [Cronobacter universalis NCTC 9529]|nr:hypothetical protein BN136_3844 [Cronobacter universalis NCTC 9529]
MARVRAAACEAHGHQRHQQRGGVGKHMAGVGQQRQRAGKQAAGNLQHHKRGGHQEGDQQTFAVTVGGMRMLVGIVRMRMGMGHSVCRSTFLL